MAVNITSSGNVDRMEEFSTAGLDPGPGLPSVQLSPSPCLAGPIPTVFPSYSPQTEVEKSKAQGCREECGGSGSIPCLLPAPASLSLLQGGRRSAALGRPWRKPKSPQWEELQEPWEAARPEPGESSESRA